MTQRNCSSTICQKTINYNLHNIDLALTVIEEKYYMTHFKGYIEKNLVTWSDQNK